MTRRCLVSSVWDVECYRGGKRIWHEHVKNLVTNEGLNALLDIMFSGSTQITTWYVALFENDHTPAVGNTYASPGYTECTAYSETTRPEYVEAEGESETQITNSANKASFTMNATKTIYGAALVGGGTAASTKGDTAGGGTLYSLSKFSGSKTFIADDVFKVTVTLNAAYDDS